MRWLTPVLLLVCYCSLRCGAQVHTADQRSAQGERKREGDQRIAVLSVSSSVQISHRSPLLGLCSPLRPLLDFLCPLSANTYGIDFLSFKIRDMDTNHVVFEVRYIQRARAPSSR